MSVEDYKKAVRQAQRCYQDYLMQGRYPYLQVLEELLNHTEVVSEVKLGLVQIPADFILGTYAAGRRTAFAPNFMPLLEPGSEFAGKWASLCKAHMEEGIREPIKAYEFMNRFYVVEGNKRVSVLKYCGAVSIPGYVTRIIPKRTDELENRVYFEFLDFYRYTEINYVKMNRLGSYRKLLELIGKEPEEVWTDEEKNDFHSAYIRFTQAFQERGGKDEEIPVGEAMIAYLGIYSYQEMLQKLPAQLKEDLGKIWEEIRILKHDHTPEILTAPLEKPKKNFLGRILGGGSKTLRITFIHSKNAQTSAWTYAHELGRMALEEQMEGQVETCCINDVTPGEALERAFDQAIADGSDIIFTTTPQFLETSLKYAVNYPDIKILNCSVDRSHSYIRTYYARLYEAKFLAGMIAGAMSDNNRIGYIADYPICGMIANINAFAIGAQMVNPRARIYLEWSSVKKPDEILKCFRAQDIQYISCQEMMIPGQASRKFGLMRMDGEETENIAMAIWNWGALYKRLIKNILNGGWKAEGSDGTALNYWWGMSADVIDVIYSQKVPRGTRRLVEYMKKTISSGDFHPFYGTLYSQQGVIHEDQHVLTPEEVIEMDWLAENVIGSFPEWEAMNEEAKAIVRLQGINLDEAKNKEDIREA